MRASRGVGLSCRVAVITVTVTATRTATAIKTVTGITIVTVTKIEILPVITTIVKMTSGVSRIKNGNFWIWV